MINFKNIPLIKCYRRLLLFVAVTKNNFTIILLLNYIQNLNQMRWKEGWYLINKLRSKILSSMRDLTAFTISIITKTQPRFLMF